VRKQRALRLFSFALLAIALALPAAAGLAREGPAEKSLLTAGGTLYTVQAGLAADLGISGSGVAPNDFAIEWSAKKQDGSRALGLVPGTVNRNPKRDLDLAFDEQTGSLVLLWSEHFSLLSDIRLAILKEGAWRTAELVPNLGLPRAHNPQMHLTHDTASDLDSEGKNISRSRSILHVIWWEESGRSQARYVPIFLEEDLGTQELTLYDLPVLVQSGGPTDIEDVPAGAYSYPTLQVDGLSGAVLASFADLTRDRRKHYVVRITYDGTLQKLRRRIPVVGVIGSGPIPSEAPEAIALSVWTVIGGGYKPTHYWRDGDTVQFLRFDGEKWAPVKSIALDEEMTYEKAARLVEEMGKRN